MAHTRKRVRKLSTAVFRSAKTEFIFDVYPISPDITDGAAVFIFSRRSLDKHGRWHHTVSCIGETASIVIEIKKHRRSKCIKTNAANVICIRKETDEDTRKIVVDDLASARTFSCLRGVFRTNARPTTDAKRHGTANILPFEKTGGNGKRVSGLSKKKREATGRAKTRAARDGGSQKKSAA